MRGRCFCRAGVRRSGPDDISRSPDATANGRGSATRSPTIDALKKIVGDMGYKVTDAADDFVDFEVKGDIYAVELSTDRTQAYVSTWVNVPKDRESKVPATMLLMQNNKDITYYSLGTDNKGVLYIALIERIESGNLSAQTMRSALDDISDEFNDHPDLTNPDKWK